MIRVSILINCKQVWLSRLHLLKDKIVTIFVEIWISI